MGTRQGNVMMEAQVDSVLRTYVPTILEAAGLHGPALRLRVVVPERASLLRACAVLDEVGRDAAGPWARTLRALAFWARAAVDATLAGRRADAVQHAERVRAECERELACMSKPG